MKVNKKVFFKCLLFSLFISLIIFLINIYYVKQGNKPLLSHFISGGDIDSYIGFGLVYEIIYGPASINSTSTIKVSYSLLSFLFDYVLVFILVFILAKSFVYFKNRF